MLAWTSSSGPVAADTRVRPGPNTPPISEHRATKRRTKRRGELRRGIRILIFIIAGMTTAPCLTGRCRSGRRSGARFSAHPGFFYGPTAFRPNGFARRTVPVIAEPSNLVGDANEKHGLARVLQDVDDPFALL